MSYEPDTATYVMEGYRDTEYYLQVKPKGAIGRFFIKHKEEGSILLTPREAEQLMECLMHFFNKEVS